jgi:hypothetical protein
VRRHPRRSDRYRRYRYSRTPRIVAVNFRIRLQLCGMSMSYIRQAVTIFDACASMELRWYTCGTDARRVMYHAASSILQSWSMYSNISMAQYHSRKCCCYGGQWRTASRGANLNSATDAVDTILPLMSTSPSGSGRIGSRGVTARSTMAVASLC